MKYLQAIFFTTLIWGQNISLPDINLISANKQNKILPFLSLSPYLIIAQNDEEALAEQLATSYLNKIPIQVVPNLTLEQATIIRDKFVQLLIPSLGKIVGYKAGLTSKSAQSRFQVSHPVQGVFLEKMLLKTGAIIPSNFGTRTILEGDLLVRIGSEKVNNATTTEEALAALDAVIPFMELPDLVYAENVNLNASALIAINVGARLGVMGEAIPLEATDEWQEKLKKIRIFILDKDNNQLAVGESKALLGDPLKVVLWIKDSLQAQGKSLKTGDLLSLGTITPPIPIKSGTTIRAQYIGLNGKKPVEISVSFKYRTYAN